MGEFEKWTKGEVERVTESTSLHAEAVKSCKNHAVCTFNPLVGSGSMQQAVKGGQQRDAGLGEQK